MTVLPAGRRRKRIWCKRPAGLPASAALARRPRQPQPRGREARPCDAGQADGPVLSRSTLGFVLEAPPERPFQGASARAAAEHPLAVQALRSPGPTPGGANQLCQSTRPTRPTGSPHRNRNPPRGRVIQRLLLDPKSPDEPIGDCDLRSRKSSDENPTPSVQCVQCPCISGPGPRRVMWVLLLPTSRPSSSSSSSSSPRPQPAAGCSLRACPSAPLFPCRPVLGVPRGPGFPPPQPQVSPSYVLRPLPSCLRAQLCRCLRVPGVGVLHPSRCPCTHSRASSSRHSWDLWVLAPRSPDTHWSSCCVLLGFFPRLTAVRGPRLAPSPREPPWSTRAPGAPPAHTSCSHQGLSRPQGQGNNCTPGPPPPPGVGQCRLGLSPGSMSGTWASGQALGIVLLSLPPLLVPCGPTSALPLHPAPGLCCLRLPRGPSCCPPARPLPRPPTYHVTPCHWLRIPSSWSPAWMWWVPHSRHPASQTRTRGGGAELQADQCDLEHLGEAWGGACPRAGLPAVAPRPSHGARGSSVGSRRTGLLLVPIPIPGPRAPALCLCVQRPQGRVAPSVASGTGVTGPGGSKGMGLPAAHPRPCQSAAVWGVQGGGLHHRDQQTLLVGASGVFWELTAACGCARGLGVPVPHSQAPLPPFALSVCAVPWGPGTGLAPP
ncbi:uncharacterized protein [Vulpes vulpes]|uniref:Basic proline-rich protein-like n=1 Tax=Vulpes vulpes TaxID=9627 RepID=A0ABM4XAG8_VULVU